MDNTNLMPMNLMNIRSRCLDRMIELLKDDKGKLSSEFGITGVQDLKVQLVDCANALAKFTSAGPSESTVGKTGLTLSTSRALYDRKIYDLTVGDFESIMIKKGFMNGAVTLWVMGLMYGENRSFPRQIRAKCISPITMTVCSTSCLKCSDWSHPERQNRKKRIPWCRY